MRNITRSASACAVTAPVTAAIGVGDAIEAAVGRLADYPRSGRPGSVAGTRELAVSGAPFVIAYRVEAEAVVVLRLLHGAQRWPSQL
jgi:toxin ParE1/3/4